MKLKYLLPPENWQLGGTKSAKFLFILIYLILIY